MLTLSLTVFLMFTGCSQEPQIPVGSFRLTTREIVRSTEINATVLELEIQASSDSSGTFLSVKYQSGRGGGGGGKIWLDNSTEGKTTSGEVFLSAARFSLDKAEQAYIQTLIRPRTSAESGAGGPSYWQVSRETELDSFLAITATNGIYSFNEPILIAELEGGPVELMVKRASK